MGVPVLVVELRQNLLDIENLADAEEAHVLFCLDGAPLCRTRLRVDRGRIAASQMRQSVESLAGDLLAERVVDSAFQENDSDDLPRCSVVICTKDRPDDVRRCLSALALAIHEDTEVIVVDNDPSDDRTREIAAEFKAVYFREVRRGVNWARARGARLASHEIVFM
ncbi:MAG: glycosyltransferase [Bryobacteraceae bacterium]